MSDLIFQNNTLNRDDPILARTSRNLGISWIGAEGTLAGAGYKILLYVHIPTRLPVSVIFPRIRKEASS
ncbi:MAG: hypothetical protein C4527_21355 [Candidatus Omnitrophota bacterium]|jgi:hypothetical protein|nr:MAG: hypothetical protein C4527_21355 [Candidatus Omnitrophota bacterium]